MVKILNFISCIFYHNNNKKKQKTPKPQYQLRHSFRPEGCLQNPPPNQSCQGPRSSSDRVRVSPAAATCHRAGEGWHSEHHESRQAQCHSFRDKAGRVLSGPLPPRCGHFSVCSALRALPARLLPTSTLGCLWTVRTIFLLLQDTGTLGCPTGKQGALARGSLSPSPAHTNKLRILLS